MQRLLLIVEAYLRLIGHDAYMFRHDFRALCQKLKEIRQRPGSKRQSSSTDVETALSIACAFYPKRVLCLERSAVLIQMLRARGVAAKMVIGMQRLPFRAHAWIEIDGDILNDRLASREAFQILEVL